MDRYQQVESELDPGIRRADRLLMEAGIETFESCEGGQGHAFPQPTVRFHGYQEEGFRALAVAAKAGLQVAHLRRVWDLIDGEPTGPHWEIVLTLDNATRADAAAGSSGYADRNSGRDRDRAAASDLTRLPNLFLV
jgi:hypothetical protein